MDNSKFVQNVKYFCERKGVKPTFACRESGAGERLLENVKRGSDPSVGKVQLLAKFLGVTTSDLLGETMSDSITGKPVSPYCDELMNCLLQLNENGQRRLLEQADDMVQSGKYSEKKSASAG